MDDHPVYISTLIDHEFHEDKQPYPIRCVGSCNCILIMNPTKGLASEADGETLDWWRNSRNKQHHIGGRFEAFF